MFLTAQFGYLVRMWHLRLDCALSIFKGQGEERNKLGKSPVFYKRNVMAEHMISFQNQKCSTDTASYCN